VLSDVSFTAPERSVKARAEGQEFADVTIDREYVEGRIQPLLKKQDLSRYML
jgi:ATP-dependent protease HslVU (ClpYQ) ATPase subunit